MLTAQSVVASFPVSSRFVPGFLETIIDKKVAGVALNRLQKWVDWLVSWIYCPYRSLYREKMARVHTFTDGQTKLFDATKNRVAGIDFEWTNDFVTLNRTKIFFHPDAHVNTVFSQQAFTDYVVIRDDEARKPGWFQIIEQEMPRAGNLNPMEKSWMVDTNRVHPVLPGYLVEQPSSF